MRRSIINGIKIWVVETVTEERVCRIGPPLCQALKCGLEAWDRGHYMALARSNPHAKHLYFRFKPVEQTNKVTWTSGYLDNWPKRSPKWHHPVLFIPTPWLELVTVCVPESHEDPHLFVVDVVKIYIIMVSPTSLNSSSGNFRCWLSPVSLCTLFIPYLGLLVRADPTTSIHNGSWSWRWCWRWGGDAGSCSASYWVWRHHFGAETI